MSDDELFDLAIKIPDEDQRQRFLNEQCGTDTQRSGFLSELVRTHFASDAFIETPAFSAIRDDWNELVETAFEKAGDRIQEFELIEEIGRGGMAVVFRARQKGSIVRDVALKIIKPGLETEQVLARMKFERQTLARMNHKNIASVFDAGVSPSGRPFFVMELVDGAPVTQFCNNQQLKLSQQLDLIIEFGRAIEHAHRRGVIHRDIKPSNLLVAGNANDPIPKIIDFGIAKFLTSETGPGDTLTSMGQILGTPQYMSPEQTKLDSRLVDTRTDVYSLGAVLYELLTGTPPIRQTHLVETLERVVQEAPVSPAKLNRNVDRDLETICLKCLEKNAEDRYESIKDLAEDLSLYQAGKPIRARKIGVGTRLVKWIRRSPAAASLWAVSLLACFVLCGTWIAFTWQLKNQRDEISHTAAELVKEKDAANRNFKQAHLAMRKYLDAVRTHTPLGSSADLMFQQELFASGISFYESLLDSPASEYEAVNLLEIQLEQADLYIEHGKIQLISLDYDASVDSFEQAIELLRSIRVDGEFDAAQKEMKIAVALTALTRTLWKAGRFEDAKNIGNEAISVFDRIPIDGPHGNLCNWTKAIALYRLARVSMDQGRTDAAADLFQQAEQFSCALPDIYDFKLTQTKALLGIAECHLLKQNPRAGIVAAEKAQRIIEVVCSRASPIAPRYTMARISCFEVLARCNANLTAPQSIDGLMDSAIRYQGQLVAEHPNVENFKLDLARLYRVRANFESRETASSRWISKAEEILGPLGTAQLTDGQAVIRARMLLNAALRERERACVWEFAARRLVEAKKLLDAIPEEKRSAQNRELLRGIVYRLAETYWRAGLYEQAAPAFTRYWQLGGAESSNDRLRHAIVLCETGALSAAESQFKKVQVDSVTASERPFLEIAKAHFFLNQQDLSRSELRAYLKSVQDKLQRGRRNGRLDTYYFLLAICRLNDLAQQHLKDPEWQSRYAVWSRTVTLESLQQMWKDRRDPLLTSLAQDPRVHLIRQELETWLSN